MAGLRSVHVGSETKVVSKNECAHVTLWTGTAQGGQHVTIALLTR